ncbi:MAG: aspartyl/asparaginyl beta-hydroxylase domain-containing protein [Proteobacteria bacterium]|nr:aspartyl/asparaginyl beta-hydroxylase domain-containing protein [Pseudomonadota bacterium]
MSQPSAAELEAAWREGIDALREGRAADALARLQRITAAGQASPGLWTAIAMAHRQTGDRAAQKAALREVLALDPRDLRALVMTGDLHAAEGDDRAADAHYAAALRLAQAAPPADPALQADIARAAERSRRYVAQYEDHILRAMDGRGLERPEARRARQSLDLLLGRQELYLQQPRHFYFPELPQIAWADRAAFPWLDRVEAATDAIRADLMRVLEEDAAGGAGAFAPYLQPEADRPNFGAATGLMDDPSWGAFYLWKAGAPQAENLARCPSVAEALAEAPLCSIPGRTPSVLFSLLRPGTHIKPHHGFTNARFICHLPLIVPEGCAMRVGPETRPWVEGRACVFDDSVEHEAWNRSPDKLRVMMIFDIWRPELSGTERELVSAMLQAVDSYGGAAAPAWDG